MGEGRFTPLVVLTTAFQIICGLAALSGLVLLLGGISDPGPMPPEVVEIIRYAGGGTLFFYGLTGLVFSGGINVLIAIYKNTAREGELAPAPAMQLQTMPRLAATPIETVVRPATCPKCAATNAPDSRFCAECGTALKAG